MLKSIILLFLMSYPLGAVEYFGLHLEKYKYPYEVKYIHLDVQQQTLSMAYMDVSPKKHNGKTILLLHGKNFTGAYWESTAKRLLKEGYRVIIPDQIGFGKSSKPKNLQYSFQMLARNTAKLMDSLNIPNSYLLGHSMGGMLAIRYSLMFPDRVKKLILENPIGLEDWQRFVTNPSFEFWYEAELSKSAEKIYNYQLQSYYDGIWKEKYQPWVDILTSFTMGADYPQVAWNQALISDMIFSQPVYYQLDQLSMPVLLIIGQRDKTALGKNLASPEVRKKMGNYPQLGIEAAKNIPNSKLIKLEGIGHMPHIEIFDSFIKSVLDFLSVKK